MRRGPPAVVPRLHVRPASGRRARAAPCGGAARWCTRGAARCGRGGRARAACPPRGPLSRSSSDRRRRGGLGQRAALQVHERARPKALVDRRRGGASAATAVATRQVASSSARGRRGPSASSSSSSSFPSAPSPPTKEGRFQGALPGVPAGALLGAQGLLPGLPARKDFERAVPPRRRPAPLSPAASPRPFAWPASGGSRSGPRAAPPPPLGWPRRCPWDGPCRGRAAP